MLWGARTSGYCQNTGAGPSHWRDRHFDDTPCLSRLKHLIQVQGGCHQMTVSPTARLALWHGRAGSCGPGLDAEAVERAAPGQADQPAWAAGTCVYATCYCACFCLSV